MHLRTNVTSDINSAILVPRCMFRIKLLFNFTGELLLSYEAVLQEAVL